MSVNIDKIHLPEHLDLRRKLTAEQKVEIKKKYATGQYTMHGLAKDYGVSDNTILLLVNPDSKARHDNYMKGYLKQYDVPRDVRNAARRNSRRRKKRLLEEGVLSL